MRKLGNIESLDDIYQSVPETDISFVESQLSIAFPERLRKIYRCPDVAKLKEMPSMLWPVEHPFVGIIEVNSYLHEREPDTFPDYVVAFATNDCGDWFCFDKSRDNIVYMDPDKSVAENLQDQSLTFDSFDDWLARR